MMLFLIFSLSGNVTIAAKLLRRAGNLVPHNLGATKEIPVDKHTYAKCIHLKISRI